MADVTQDIQGNPGAPAGGNEGGGDGGNPGSGGDGGDDPDPGKPDEVKLSKAEYDELMKLKEKDINFEKLRKKAESATEEKTKVLSDYEKKMEEFIQKTQESNKEWQSEFLKKQHQSQFEAELKSLAGDNKELREKIEFHYKRLGGAENQQEIGKILREGYLLATGRQAKPASPVNRVAASQGSPAYPGSGAEYQSNNSYADSAEGRVMLQHMFPTRHYPNAPWNKK